MKRILVLLLALSMGVAWAQAPMDLDQALDYLSKYEFGQSRAPLEVVVKAVRDANADTALKQKLEARFSELLISGAPLDAKRFIGRELAVMGTAASVPALTGLLSDANTADFALRALEGIPGAEAQAALQDAAKSLPDTMKLGAITELGRRGNPEAVPVLAELLKSADGAVALAAAYALGRIGGDTACETLHGALPNAAPELKNALLDGCLNCAAAAEGEKGVALYNELAAEGQPGHVRAAALAGLIKADPSGAQNRVVAALSDPDAELVRVAAGFVRDQNTLPGISATRAVAGLLDKADAAKKIMLLDALADRGDSAAGPAVIKVAEDVDPAVSLAAIRALGRVGNASCTESLLTKALNTESEIRRTARTSLSTLPGNGVDAELVRLARKGKADARVEAVRALTDRRATGMKRDLLSMAGDSEVQGEVFKAMQAMGDAKDLPALFALLEKAKDQAGREPVEGAIGAICMRFVKEDERADAVLDKLKSVSNPDLKASYLRILGGIPAAASLDALRKAAQDSDPALRITAIAKLGNWPDAAPLEDLKGIAAAPKSEEERGAALKGYIRLLRMANNRPMAELVARYAEIFTLAKNDSERKAALSGLAGVPSLKALEMAQQQQADAAVAGEAGNAALKIAQAISGVYPDKAKAVAEPMLKPDTTEPLKKAADGIMKTLGGFEDYVTAWEVSGPYSEEGVTATKLFDTAYPPEKGEGVWQIMPMGTDIEHTPAFVANLGAFAPGRECVAYLRSMITSPKAQAASLELGSNDGVKVWLNGELVHSLNKGRILTPAEDKIAVQLKEGANTLLVAVYQQGGDWGACARFRQPDGNPLPEVKGSISE
ncbi:MAG TPA: HEAT repeat domain-containing protein [Candidatus Hydrogenedentes bacterium]|nr:HEAT repeat domain-containing protein [Candidatus Hydrogenedentota bacterium]